MSMNRKLHKKEGVDEPSENGNGRTVDFLDESAVESGRLRRFYETILASTPDLIYVFDLDHRFTFANDALLQVWGMTWDEAKGKNCLELGYEPWQAEMHGREIEQVKATKRAVSGDVPFVGTAGRRIYDYIFVPVIGENGEVEAIAGTTRDITERKRGEDELRESEQKMKALYEAEHQVSVKLKRKAALIELSHDPIFAWDPQEGIVEWNRGAERLYGYSFGEARGRISHELLRTVYPLTFDDYVTELHANGNWLGEVRHITKDGVTLIIESRQQMIGSKGRHLILETNRDITQTRQIEQERKLLASIVESSMDFVSIADAAGHPIYVNPAGLELIGIEGLDEVSRSPPTDYFVPEERSFITDVVIPTIITNGRWSGELTFRHFKTGVSIPVLCDVFRVDDPVTSQPVNLASVIRDVTDRKRAELALLNSEERFRAAIAAVSDLIWTNNAGGLMEGEQQGWGDFTGQSREEYQGYGWSKAVHPDDAQPTIDAWYKAVAEKRTFEFEHRVRRRDGEWRDCTIRAVPVFNPDGTVREWVGVHADITDRKQTELALTESEERCQITQRAGNVGIWDWDALAGRTYWSETMWSIYGEEPNGIDPDDAYWSEYLHGSDRERVKLNLQGVLESKDETQFRDEYRIVRKDGSIRWIEAVAKVSRAEDGSPTRMYGVNLDVTSRKEAEERVRLSENQLRLVTNAVPALISYVDSSERYRFVNQKFTDWFGIPTDEIVGKRVRDIFGSQAYRVIKPKIDAALAGHECTFETALNYKVVGTRYVHISYMPDIGVDGTVHGYYGLTHDLTDLKRSQDLLRSSEERIGLMMESMVDYAVFSMDSEGRIDSWNKGAEIIFGYKHDEIIGQSSEILFTPEDVADGIHSREMQVARQKGRASDDRWHLRKDGTRFYAIGTLMPLHVGQALAGYAKIARDLTEKQRHADELQRAHDDLERRVVERTTELNESILALVQEMEVRDVAEKQRTELQQRLVTSQETERRRIAHDLHDHLGQLLTALRLKIASLKDFAKDNEEFATRVERLQEIAQQLDSEVSFLAWELRPTALDDLGLVDAVGAFVNEWSRHYKVPADFYSSGLAHERLDGETETHVYRIAQEALNNIVKHAAAENVTVLLERKNENLILIIEDDGKGFDPGKQRKPGESTKGLGLVGMRERAALVGGNVEIESARGRGTTIFVRIPIAL